MPTVKLSAIVDALQAPSDEVHAFLDKQTGEVFVLWDDEIRAVEDGEDLDDWPEWQEGDIERTQAVQADEAGRFAPLPDRFEIDEWDMMRDFAVSLDNEEQSQALLNAIQGRGAFRYFKDRIHELSLADAWYEFREEQYRQVALDWCQANGIEADPNA